MSGDGGRPRDQLDLDGLLLQRAPAAILVYLVDRGALEVEFVDAPKFPKGPTELLLLFAFTFTQVQDLQAKAYACVDADGSLVGQGFLAAGEIVGDLLRLGGVRLPGEHVLPQPRLCQGPGKQPGILAATQ